MVSVRTARPVAASHRGAPRDTASPHRMDRESDELLNDRQPGQVSADPDHDEVDVLEELLHPLRARQAPHATLYADEEAHEQECQDRGDHKRILNLTEVTHFRIDLRVGSLKS